MLIWICIWNFNVLITLKFTNTDNAIIFYILFYSIFLLKLTGFLSAFKRVFNLQKQPWIGRKQWFCPEVDIGKKELNCVYIKPINLTTKFFFFNSVLKYLITLMMLRFPMMPKLTLIVFNMFLQKQPIMPGKPFGSLY